MEKLDTMNTKTELDFEIGKLIDHTILNPMATEIDIEKACKEAILYKFASVCVNPSNIMFVTKLLKGTSIKPITVIGFPLGSNTTQTKIFEAKNAIYLGAQEIDMVINIGALKSKNYKMVYNDIKQIVEASKPYIVKVIIESSQLNESEKIIACTIAKTAEADFIKTSTGFGQGKATVEDIKLIRKIIGSDMLIKASGGIRTREDAKKMLEAGANRIGSSSSVNIITK